MEDFIDKSNMENKNRKKYIQIDLEIASDEIFVRLEDITSANKSEIENFSEDCNTEFISKEPLADVGKFDTGKNDLQALVPEVVIHNTPVPSGEPLSKRKLKEKSSELKWEQKLKFLNV